MAPLHRFEFDWVRVETEARCACGWRGPTKEGASHADCLKDYGEHVEQALGAGAYCVAGVGCENCGSRHEQGILEGTIVRDNRCDKCGAESLVPQNDVVEEKGLRSGSR